MARLRSKHSFLLSKNSNETNQVYEQVQRDDELTDAYAKASSVSPITLAPGGQATLALQGLTAVQWLFIETDKQVHVALNGSADLIPVTPRNNTSTPAGSIPGRMYLMTDGITSIALSNLSSTDTASVTVAFAGS